MIERSEAFGRELARMAVDLRAEREVALEELGPRPSWLRQSARRRWDHKRAKIVEHYLALAKNLAVLNGNTDAGYMQSLEYAWR